MWLFVTAALAQEATMHHRFDDAAHWAQVFDDPARDAWQKPAELVAALGIPAGATAADIGAGTGYLEPHLATAVGADGKVLAIDVEPNLIDHMKQRFAEAPNVEPRLAEFADPKLNPGEADWVVLVDTYHHIDGRVDYFRKVRTGVAKKGHLAIVDFRTDVDAPHGPPREHRIAPDQVESELKEAGWKFDRAVDGVLPYQYVLVFRR